MRIGFTSGEMASLRTRPHSTKWRLHIHKPRVIASVTKTGAYSDHPIHEVTFSPSIATSLINRNSSIWLAGGSVAGSGLGRVRLRRIFGNTHTSRVGISESGSGLIDWQNVGFFHFMDQHEIWTKHPRYHIGSSVWLNDYDEVDPDFMANLGPYVTSMHPIVAQLENGVYSASLVGPTVIPIDGHSSLDGGFEWKFPNGVTVTSKLGSTGDPLIINFTGASPNGAYYSFKATDALGASTIGRRLIFLYDNIDAQSPRVSFGSINGGYESGGYTAQIGVPKNAGYLNIIDGAEVVISQDSRYGQSKLNINGNEIASARNILFRGWLSEEDTAIEPFSSTTTFVVQSGSHELDKAHAYDIFLRNDGEIEERWQDTGSLTLNRVAAHILKDRTTAAEILNFYRPTDLAETEQIRYQALPRGTAWQQLRANYGERGYLGLCSADMLSSINAFQDVQISGGSNNLISTTLTSRDIRNTVSVFHPHKDDNAQSRLYAVSDETPLIAESPGKAAGYHGGFQEISQGLLVDSQQTLIKWSGNLRAKLNNKYPYTVVPLAGNYPIDSVPQSIIKLSTAPDENSRGLRWTEKPFVTKETTMEYDSISGYANTTIAVESMTRGLGGEKVDFPEIIPPPQLPPPPSPGPIVPIPPGAGDGFGTVYVVDKENIYRTRDFSAASPAWVGIKGSVTGVLHDFILDPWGPATTGYLATPDGIWKSTNLNLSSPTWTNVANVATLTADALAGAAVGGWLKLVATISNEGWIAMAYSSNRASFCATTKNGGTSWDINVIQSTTSGNTISFHGGFDINQTGNNRMYAMSRRNTAKDVRLFRSDDFGATWTLKATLRDAGVFANSYRGKVLHIPYNDNPNGDVAYYIVDTFSTSGLAPRFYRTINGGDSSAVIATSPEIHGLTTTKRGMGTYTQDRLNLSYWRHTLALDTGAASLTVSDDGGDTWTGISSTGLSGQRWAGGGFPYNGEQLYVVTDTGVFVSTDRGVNWANKTGDLPTMDLVEGLGTVVPLWLAE